MKKVTKQVYSRMKGEAEVYCCNLEANLNAQTIELSTAVQAQKTYHKLLIKLTQKINITQLDLTNNKKTIEKL